MKKILLPAMAAIALFGFNPNHGKEHLPFKTSTDTLPGKKIIVFTTALHTGYKISATDTLRMSAFGQPKETQPCIFVDPGKTFQTFLGIGGAITDAVAETYAKLPAVKQKEILQAYFNAESGIGYNLVRTNIQSCDFSSDTYSYVSNQDPSLKTYSVAHDEKYRIPLLKKAMAEAKGQITLFASPWSPPAWMKDNNDVLHGGKLKPAFYQSWADYYVRFLKAYQAEGISFWGLSVQNEPMAVQTWESCNYSATDERDFIKNYLGPTIGKSEFPNTKIIAWDHNRDLIYQRASTILDDPDAAKYVWGIGFHWYEDWTGGGKIFDNVKRVNESYPSKNLIFTEGCAESFHKEKMMDWKWGEAYGRNMINDFNNGTVGWTDWNILLDEQGGPNHVGNFCFAPVHADTKTGELTYLNSFYYIGHFSKFIRPGAKRIVSASSRGQLLTTAFQNTDGKIVVVVMNQSDEKLPYHLWIAGNAAEVNCLPHSIETLIVE